MQTNNSVLVIGCGDIGQRVATLHLQHGDSVNALARTTAHAERLEAQGITTLMGDLDDPLTLSKLPIDDALVYYFVPPPEGGNTDPRMRNFVGMLTLKQTPKKLVYLSTSGVYGDRQGAWVDEDTPPNPQTARAKARLAAEMALTYWSRQTRVFIVILRVGGIYGSGRLPVERIRQGFPVVRSEECPYTNRIHADDLARICISAGKLGKASVIYNVCDNEPSNMTHYFNSVADLLGLPRPPALSLADAQRVLSPGMLSYLNESRRMDNRRMREELGVTLLYPNLEAGLAGLK